MRVRVATTGLGITTAALLALSACSGGTTGHKPASASSTLSGKPGAAERNDAPLSSDVLRERLLDWSDLGSGYARKPQGSSGHDDVTVLGCPALSDLGGETALGGSLHFPRHAKAAFAYRAGSVSEVSEELYSGTAGKLSTGTSRIFDAMAGCPEYQVLVGGRAVDIATRKLSVPRLGEEGWSQLMALSAGGRKTLVKQTAVREGSVLVVVSGSPALVDRHIDKALAKATAVR